MADCTDFPTPEDAKRFKNNTDSTNEFVTSDNDTFVDQDGIVRMTMTGIRNSSNIEALVGDQGASLVGTVDGQTVQSKLNSNESDISALQSGQNSGTVGFATQSDLYANLDYPDKSVAYVTNDQTPTNNGTYRKSGASGGGSWVQTSSDLASQAYQRTFPPTTPLDSKNKTEAVSGKTVSERLSARNVADLIDKSNYDDSHMTVIGSIGGKVDANYNCTDFIPVAPGDVVEIRSQMYSFTSNYKRAYSYKYYQQKAFTPLAFEQVNEGWDTINYKVPQGVFYIKVGTAQPTHPSYVPGSAYVKVKSVDGTRVISLSYPEIVDNGTQGTLEDERHQSVHLSLPVSRGCSVDLRGLVPYLSSKINTLDGSNNIIGTYNHPIKQLLIDSEEVKQIVIHSVSRTGNLHTDEMESSASLSVDIKGNLNSDVDKLKTRFLIKGKESYEPVDGKPTFSSIVIPISGAKYYYHKGRFVGAGDVIVGIDAQGNKTRLYGHTATFSRSYNLLLPIPDGYTYIEAISINSTHTDYRPLFELNFGVSDNEADLTRDAKEMMSTLDQRNHKISDFPNVGAVIGSATTFNNTGEYPFSPGLEINVNVDSPVSGSGTMTDVSGVAVDMPSQIPLTVKTSHFGVMNWHTYNQTHSAYDTSFTPSVGVTENFEGARDMRDTSISKNYLDTPTLKATRDIFYNDGTERHSTQYLWADKNNNFFVSSNNSDKGVFAFSYDKKKMYDLDPHYFSMGFDASGNIVCVYRTEYLPQTGDEGQRRNPIILHKDKGYQAEELDILIDGKRPSGWFQNEGFMATDEYIIFSEYTRPSVATCNIWRATYPLTDASNWKIVQTLVLDPAGVGIKHFHSVEKDPHTGYIYTTSGDSDTGAAMFVSKDEGLTFTKILDGSEKYCRVINFIWLKDYIYWASDSSGINHFVFKAQRDENGVLDVNNIIDLHQFPGQSAPTYASIHVQSLDLVVFLGRHDSPKGELPIDVLDLTDDTFHADVSNVPPVGGLNQSYGFRCEAFEFVPRGNDFSCGFSQSLSHGGYLNLIGILGNTNNLGSKVNNIKLSVSRVKDSFRITYGVTL